MAYIEQRQGLVPGCVPLPTRGAENQGAVPPMDTEELPIELEKALIALFKKKQAGTKVERLAGHEALARSVKARDRIGSWCAKSA
jgi:hypothetical protein